MCSRRIFVYATTNKVQWKNPRATAIVFAVCVSLIFATRYLNVLRYFFKGAYSVLGLVAAGEIAGKAVLGSGMATQFRPKKYYTIRKESLERFLDDVEQMINFVVIEFQRILYVENIWVTVAVCVLPDRLSQANCTRPSRRASSRTG